MTTARWLAAHHERLARRIVAREFERHPDLDERWGMAGRERCEADASRHIRYLAEAVASDSYPLWRAYVGWLKALLHGLGIGDGDLLRHLRVMAAVLNEEMPPASLPLVRRPIDQALAEFESLSHEPSSCLPPGEPHHALACAYLEALLARRHRDGEQLVMEAAQRSVPIAEIYLHVFQPVLREVGRLWQMNRIDVALEHYCTAVTQRVMTRLYQLLFATGADDQPRPRVAIACVAGELHEVGARMVADFLELHGWDTLYFGADVPLDALMQRLVDEAVPLLGVSATIAENVDAVRGLIATVRAEPRCADVKIMVGGYPFLVEENLWQAVGADACVPDAQAAIAVARRLIDDRPPSP